MFSKQFYFLIYPVPLFMFSKRIHSLALPFHLSWQKYKVLGEDFEADGLMKRPTGVVRGLSLLPPSPSSARSYWASWDNVGRFYRMGTELV